MEAKIWRDKKLRGNDEFGAEIEENLPQSAILLSILSPRYLKSDWCVREVNMFCVHAKQSVGLKVGNKVRVFRVLTKSLDQGQFSVFPDLGDKSTGYEFYQYDERDREAWLDPDMGSGEEYRRRIYNLSDDIAELICGIENSTGQAPESDESTANKDLPTVYLAECSHDRREDREKIAGSLRGHGYRIVPDDRLPTVEAECIEEVGKLLDECQLSVHIIGSSYGVGLDGSEKSNVVVQNELAAERAGSSRLQRLIWLPRSMTVDQPKQQAFVEALQNTSEAQLGADLIEADLETLKGTMHRMLTDIQNSEKQETLGESPDGKTVYIVCAQCDRGETLDLRKFLKANGYTVKIPVFEGDSATVRKANEANFKAASAVVLFYGQADEAWRATTENELTRMGGLREGSPLLGTYTYLAGPEKDEKKEMIELEEEGLINGLSGFSEEIMANFLKAVPL